MMATQGNSQALRNSKAVETDLNKIMARGSEAFERDVHNWGDLSSRCPEVLWNVERGAVRNSWSQRRPHKKKISWRVMGLWESVWRGKGRRNRLHEAPESM